MPLFEFFKQSLDHLKSGRQNLSVAWNQILGNLKESKNILQHVTDALTSILSLVHNRIVKNDHLIDKVLTNQNQLESSKLPIPSEDLNLSDEECVGLANKLEALALK